MGGSGRGAVRLDNFLLATAGRAQVGPKGRASPGALQVAASLRFGCPARCTGRLPPRSLAGARLARQSRRPGAPDRSVVEGRARDASKPRSPVRLLRAPADGAGWSGRRRAEPRVLRRSASSGCCRSRWRRTSLLTVRTCAAPGVGSGARLRGRLLLRADVLDAGGGPVRLAGPGGPGGAVLRPPGRSPCPCSGGCPPGPSGWRSRGRRWRCCAARWPFSGMPWGRLAFAVVDTPVAPAARVRRGDRRQPAARPRPVRCSPRCCMRDDPQARRAAWDSSRRPRLLLAPAVRPVGRRPRTARSGSRRCRATCRATAPTCSTTSARSPTTTSRRPCELADEVAAGERELPDFVLWPENSTAVDPFADAQTRTGIETAVAAIGVPILVGAMVDAGPDHVMNQGIVWDPVLGGGDRYTKRHPVPFGEYIPWRNVFGDSFGKLDMIPRDMLSGHPQGAARAWAARWSRTPSASTSPTTTGSTTRSPTAPRWSSCRRATRCSSTPPRSSSSSRSPGCARSSCGRPLAIASINGRHGDHRRRTATSWHAGRPADHDRPRHGRSPWTHSITPGTCVGSLGRPPQRARRRFWPWPWRCSVYRRRRRTTAAQQDIPERPRPRPRQPRRTGLTA